MAMEGTVSSVALIFLVWIGVIYRMNRRISTLEERVRVLEETAQSSDKVVSLSDRR